MLAALTRSSLSQLRALQSSLVAALPAGRTSRHRGLTAATSNPEPIAMQNGAATKLPPVGFYGGGMMAEAILRGLLSKRVIQPDKISVCELIEERRNMLSRLDVHVTDDAFAMLQKSKVVIIAVKPDVVPKVLKVITEHEKRETGEPEQLFVSICAGVTLDALQAVRLDPYEAKPSRKCVRVMPNQPCLVGEAASAFSLSKSCSAEDREIVKQLMGACGLAVELPEKNLNAVTGLSGSGPAYVFMMIEALADGGVQKGLPRAVALKLAAQTVLGAAKMTLESPNVHPAELRNRVESPGGTTIAGTAALESGGFRASVIEAVTQATERSENIGKK